MKPSKVLRKLRNGEVVNCINVHFDPQVTDIVGRAGFDCVWIDNEHLAQDWSSLQTHIWAAKSNDMDVMVRVSRGGYSDYIKPLEMDATGIMVPHIMGIDDAREIVQMTRFHPIGRRPLDGGNADGAYGTINYADYLPLANRERFIIIQIEDPEPMADLDAIASLDGIDMLFFGPADFSQGIGAPGDWDHPKLMDARRRVAEVAIRQGKFAGTTGNINNMNELMELGYKFINLGADVLAVGEYSKNLMAGFSKNIEG